MLTMKALFHRIFVCCSLFVPQEFSLSDYDFQQRLSDCVRANPFFFLRRKKNLKKKELQGGCPLDPRRAGETPQPHVVSAGRIQYRPHNADRSERRLLNVLPRTEKPSPPRGRQRRNRAARIADERLLPEHGNFLRCAQHLCCLPLPACPFPGGSRGAEPH